METKERIKNLNWADGILYSTYLMANKEIDDNSHNYDMAFTLELLKLWALTNRIANALFIKEHIKLIRGN